MRFLISSRSVGTTFGMTVGFGGIGKEAIRLSESLLFPVHSTKSESFRALARNLIYHVKYLDTTN
jgi:hypothetical protein